MSTRSTLVIDPEAQPCLQGYDAVVEFCKERLGVEVTRRFIKVEKERDALPYFLIANKVAFAPRDVTDWIQSLKERSRKGR
jgi:hypothetical protein